MSSNKSPNQYNGAPPKYLNDFSKALASEVRILLAEVGQLRDERRQLQFEIAELMALKSKHGAGGEYSPDWRPQPQDPPPPPPPPPPVATPPPIDDGPPVQARPAWKVVHKSTRREKAPKSLPPAPAPAPVPAIEAPKPNLPAWAQWRPDPTLIPTTIAPGPVSPRPMTPAARPGLFGPPSPPLK